MSKEIRCFVHSFRGLCSGVALTVVLVLAGGHPVYGAGANLEPFFGKYEGTAVMDHGTGVQKRDIGVEILRHERGFTLEWVTVTYKADGTPKRKNYSVHFEPSGRTDIYASAMRTNMFGDRIPLDPLQGHPYMWARISGATLTVFVMFVSESGGYEMQTYDRTLTKSGMELRFSRVRDGIPLRTVTGTLRRIR
jgi:hypothetical protein